MDLEVIGQWRIRKVMELGERVRVEKRGELRPEPGLLQEVHWRRKSQKRG